eukprot:365960-Chlamydomonas_euryale.AAC.13
MAPRRLHMARSSPHIPQIVTTDPTWLGQLRLSLLNSAENVEMSYGWCRQIHNTRTVQRDKQRQLEFSTLRSGSARDCSEAAQR